MAVCRLLRIVLAILSVAAVSLVSIEPTRAATRQTIVVDGLDPLTFEFGPIPGSYPLTAAAVWWPSECADRGPGSLVCDTIPVELVAPTTIGSTDEWYVVFTLTWDHHGGVNNLDMYLWDNGQIKDKQGRRGPTRLDTSAGEGHPEHVKLYAPSLDRYNITVLNWSGPNLGYRITAQMFVSRFDRPFEAIAPEHADSIDGDDFSDDGGVGFSEDVGSPPFFDFSLGAAEGAMQPAPAAFGEVAVAVDDDFAAFAPTDFDGRLAPPPVPVSGPVMTSARPPKDVPLSVALFWFGVVPIAILTGMRAVLVRHKRNQLALGDALPTPASGWSPLV